MTQSTWYDFRIKGLEQGEGLSEPKKGIIIIIIYGSEKGIFLLMSNFEFDKKNLNLMEKRIFLFIWPQLRQRSASGSYT